MRERPDLHAQYHRVVQPALDARPRHIGGDHEHERDQGKHRGDVVRPEWRTPQHQRSGTRPTEAPDEKYETSYRCERVQTLPWAFADARDLREAPRVGEDAQGVHAEKEDQAKD